MRLAWFLVLTACVDPGAAPDEDTLAAPPERVGHSPRRTTVEAPPRPDTPEESRFADTADPDEDPALSAFLWQEGTIHSLDLELDADALAALADDTEDPAEDVHGTLVYEGEQYSVGVRIKGSATRRGMDGKPSLKIDVHQFRPFQRFYGLRRLTLNNMVQDESMLKEHVIYAFYRSLGVPAPRHGYVRLRINGVRYGLYGLVESMDKQFIDGQWAKDDDGNLYEGGYGADVRQGHAAFAVQATGTPPPPADLETLIDTLSETPDAAILAALDQTFDRDELLTALAVDLVLGGWDGYARAANNFLLYHAPDADRWHLVPWGQDQAFTDRYAPIHAGWEGRLVVVCGRDPACAEALYRRVAEVNDAVETSELLGYATAVSQTVRGDCAADTRVEIPCEVDDILEFIAERPAIVREELDE